MVTAGRHPWQHLRPVHDRVKQLAPIHYSPLQEPKPAGTAWVKSAVLR
jgi:hypothetical protein